MTFQADCLESNDFFSSVIYAGHLVNFICLFCVQFLNLDDGETSVSETIRKPPLVKA